MNSLTPDDVSLQQSHCQWIMIIILLNTPFPYYQCTYGTTQMFMIDCWLATYKEQCTEIYKRKKFQTFDSIQTLPKNQRREHRNKMNNYIFEVSSARHIHGSKRASFWLAWWGHEYWTVWRKEGRYLDQFLSLSHLLCILKHWHGNIVILDVVQILWNYLHNKRRKKMRRDVLALNPNTHPFEHLLNNWSILMCKWLHPSIARMNVIAFQTCVKRPFAISWAVHSTLIVWPVMTCRWGLVLSDMIR